MDGLIRIVCVDTRHSSAVAFTSHPQVRRRLVVEAPARLGASGVHGISRRRRRRRRLFRLSAWSTTWKHLVYQHLGRLRGGWDGKRGRRSAARRRRGGGGMRVLVA